MTVGLISNTLFSPFVPRQDVRDTTNALVEAHHGGLIQAGNFIYWVGFSMANIVNGTNFDSNLGVQLYHCPGNLNNPGYLKQWTFIGTILQNPIQTGTTPWASAERAHIVYNANTGLYVLGCHVRTHDNLTHRCAFATASNIEGPWSWVNQGFDPSGHGVADFNMYTNAANTLCYLVYTGSPDGTGQNIGMYITQMDSTFTTSAVATNTVTTSGQREAPVLFDNGTNMFLLTSLVDPWPATNVDCGYGYVVGTGLDPIAASWPNIAGSTLVFPTSPPSNGYNGCQGSFFFKPAGKSQGILGSDIWFLDGTNGDTSRQGWSPLTITSTTITATQPASWNISDLV